MFRQYFFVLCISGSVLMVFAPAVRKRCDRQHTKGSDPGADLDRFIDEFAEKFVYVLGRECEAPVALKGFEDFILCENIVYFPPLKFDFEYELFWGIMVWGSAHIYNSKLQNLHTLHRSVNTATEPVGCTDQFIATVYLVVDEPTVTGNVDINLVGWEPSVWVKVAFSKFGIVTHVRVRPSDQPTYVLESLEITHLDDFSIDVDGLGEGLDWIMETIIQLCMWVFDSWIKDLLGRIMANAIGENLP